MMIVMATSVLRCAANFAKNCWDYQKYWYSIM